ncbi:hypothetical protein PIB30_019141 [Stylosanthes scabra]|uniref:Uncharacterized protein n=1 Tax=Stylosanthes scabra TaxID=79078 RepID=A0ABU6X707_9FABA|nr:hypothetical protein [Stylosanthes scabra]
MQNDVVTYHLNIIFGSPVLLHLKNPLLENRMGRVSLFDIDKGKEIPFQFPVDWSWFQIISSSDGFICARFSYDLMFTHLIIWNPITNTRKFIDDPAADNFPRNMYCPNLAVYTFFQVPNEHRFLIMLLQRNSYVEPGYNMHFYNSASLQWSDPMTIPSSIDILCNQSIVVGWRIFFVNKLAVYGNRTYSIIGFCMRTGTWMESIIPFNALHSFSPKLVFNGDRIFLVDVDPSGLLFGLHLHEIIISDDWGLEWATSRFCTFSYISQTPSIMVGGMLLGLIHSVTNLDISDPAFEETLSEIQFTMVDVYNGHSFVAGTMLSNAILGVSRVYSFAPTLEKKFGCL